MPGRPKEAVVRRMRVAQGLEPADLVVRGAVVVNVYTGELHPDSVIATSGDRIAYVGPPIQGLTGENTQVLDAKGRYAIPGLIDGHTHLLGARYCPEEALPRILASGTTSVVTELAEPASVVGLAGIRAGMEAVRDQPVKVFVTLPPLACAASFMEDVALELEGVPGAPAAPRSRGTRGGVLGEPRAAGGPADPGPCVTALEAGKVVEGHGAGARGGRLSAYAAAGITSCHEPITPEEVLERLRMGYHTMVREGKVRQEMEAVASEWRESGVDLRRLCLVTDSVAADQLLELGYMDHLLRKAIRLGMDPVRAVQAVTLNVAEHSRLDHLIGGLAPGRYADLVLTPDLRDFRAEVVVANGRVVAEDGKVLVSFRPPRYLEALCRTVPPACLVSPDALRVPAPGRKGSVRVRTGGYATTMAWDAHCLVAVGCSPENTALAIRLAVALGGGCAVVSRGEIRAELPAPVAGVVSTLPLEEVARRERAVDQVLRELGAGSPRPSLTVDVLTATAIPHFKISAGTSGCGTEAW
ncbi:MAG: amidohydrolase family protein [Armatimonadetes bacterium]|nr:amidohydrolase family protein [Armatimonadota bacterium]MDW8152713.1 adenine deaminase C-terminal domain-containing protein [Armatimonadota bacterium]